MDVPHMRVTPEFMTQNCQKEESVWPDASTAFKKARTTRGPCSGQSGIVTSCDFSTFRIEPNDSASNGTLPSM